MAGNVRTPTTLPSVTHFNWNDDQIGIEAQGCDPVIDALESVTVDVRTSKTRCDEAKESGLMNMQMYAIAGYPIDPL